MSKGIGLSGELKAKVTRFFGCLLTTLIATFSAQGQGFVNLDFEAAKVIPVSTNLDGSVNVATTDALPGWVAFHGTNQLSLIPFNYDPTGSHGVPPVGLYGGTNVIVPQGKFVVRVGFGSSISQTGFVPTAAESLLFDVVGTSLAPCSVFLNGQNLPYLAVSNAIISEFGHDYPYVVFGADISAFAGQTVTLTFSGTPETGNPGTLDDIQFSSSPVPEPGGLSLLALGSGALVCLRLRRRAGKTQSRR